MRMFPDAARLSVAAAGVLFSLSTLAQAPAQPVSTPTSAPAVEAAVTGPKATLAGQALLTTDSSTPSPKGFLPQREVVQRGITGVVPLRRDEFLLVTDNGRPDRSKDAETPLAIHRVRADWTQGRIKSVGSLFLRDPDQKLPFPLQNTATRERFLTGADLNPESLQAVGKELWVGDDYGPYIVRFDLTGKALGLIETLVGKQALRSLDAPIPAAHTETGLSGWMASRGAGLGGLALSIDGSRVYPVLSGPIWNEASQSIERIDGRAVVRILEVDAASRQFTGRFRYYALESDQHRVSDFQMLDATTGILIERDDRAEGQPLSCAFDPASDCPARPTAFKRLVKIDLAKAGPDRVVRKVGSIDLLRVANPRQMAKVGPNDPTFSLPHQSIDALALVNGSHAVVVNNNHGPSSAGRNTGDPDDSEFTLLDLNELIQTR